MIHYSRFFLFSHLIETRGVHQDWDPEGHNKNVMRMGGFICHGGMIEQLDMTLIQHIVINSSLTRL